MNPSQTIKLVFNNFGAKIAPRRHLAPEVIGKLLRHLPMDTYAFPLGSILHIRVDLKCSGRVKVTDLFKGDIFYDTTQDSLAITFKPKKALRGELKVGEVLNGIERLEKISGVETVRITL